LSSNIGPEAHAKYQQYLDAGSLEDKIKFLEEFISLVPKHKATENIVALNRSRLSKMKQELEKHKLKQKSLQKVVSPFSIKKEGIQIILISCYQTPGTGKTTILNYLTGAANDKIGRFTPLPEVGIYNYNNIRFQIVDMPSIMKDASDGVGNGKEIISQIRSCDLLCICVDLSKNFKEQMDLILTELNKSNIKINAPPPPINIQKTGSNKIQVLFMTKKAKTLNEIENLTENIKAVVYANGIRNAIVRIYGEISIDQISDALNPSVVYKKIMLLGTKGDLSHTEEPFNKLRQNYLNKFPLILGTSIKKKNFPDNFGEIILRFLKKIKIYTMSSGKVAEKPLIMDENPTIKDVAIKIHRSFYELFDHAIVIREGERQKRKKVGLEYVLNDNDIIELHTI